ncbi:F-box/kelch-repeat protein [Hibiscus syriacus]|uniref:F-box/kelch-repeat protein n=1 Tax=Hibiscus syriacus TaxID=106335 RepID=A0A6A2YAH8_HIBSY|nr:F-box/kelch-repeat protein [Hibiscus syriacus]
MKTYALAWIDSAVKLSTCIDRVGGENPTWNDKFLFRVSPEFLYSETSGISIEIFADGIFRDTLVGTVRLLVGNIIRNGSPYIPVRVPSLNAVQVRRPSGRFQGFSTLALRFFWVRMSRQCTASPPSTP